MTPRDISENCVGCLLLREENESLVKQVEEKTVLEKNATTANDELKNRVEALENVVSDMNSQLQPLRLRQLIEAGRTYFWGKCCIDYNSAHPDKVDSRTSYDYDNNTEVLSITPKNWSHFIRFADKKYGKATYWKLLAGGFGSEFSSLCEVVHNTDAYTIAMMNLRVPQTYNELFIEVFKMTMNEAIEKGPTVIA